MHFTMRQSFILHRKQMRLKMSKPIVHQSLCLFNEAGRMELYGNEFPSIPSHRSYEAMSCRDGPSCFNAISSGEMPHKMSMVTHYIITFINRALNT